MVNTTKKILKLLSNIDIIKTIRFNFHYFPPQKAILLPVFIYKRSKILKRKGKIIIEAPIKPGMVRFGPYGLGTQDYLYSRTIWEVMGTLIIKGKIKIGRGSKISIGKEGNLTLGDQFTISGKTEIICHKKITFGDNCLLSWDILVMDTDFHHIFNEKGEEINPPKPIIIGNNVWIGCRNTILKGVTIQNNNVIAANSTITRSFTNENCIIGGNGNNMQILKTGINWKY